MIEKVAENIYSIPVPLPNNPLKNLNSYLVRSGERDLLIDTGFRQQACREALFDGLKKMQVDLQHLDVFLTHMHSDHSGLAPELAARGARIYVGETDRLKLPGVGEGIDWERSDRSFAIHGFPENQLEQLTQANPAKVLAPVPYDGYLPVREGDMFRVGIYCFKALDTPGHTPGHMCLYEPDAGIIFLGDHVLFDITPNIISWGYFPNSLGAYLEALDKVDALDVTLPLPAHRTFNADLHTRIAAIQAHHRDRCTEVLRILDAEGPMMAYDLTGRMTWKIRCRSWEEFPLAQKWFAMGEALAHLEYLIALGKVERTLNGLHCHYMRVPEQNRKNVDRK
ncbi:MAG: MBL fold metallo-hydrolase [Oscillospiraceae bacterium]|nr:MBL fold metallo-hydrolase [Oscillospiraceae bacterium]